jgi:hypothetical protein
MRNIVGAATEQASSQFLQESHISCEVLLVPPLNKPLPNLCRKMAQFFSMELF